MANELFGRLSRAINNPVVQNVLGAGAIAAGAGPLFGLLSIPAMQSERRKATNENLTNEDLRLSIMSKRRSMDALDRLTGQNQVAPGLLGPDPTNPLIENFGAPGEDVPGFTFANPEREAQRQSDLASTLVELAGPQGANQVLQSMFPQATQRSEPTDLRMMRVFGFDLSTPQAAQESWRKYNELKGSDIERELQQTLASTRLLELRAAERDAELEALDLRSKRRFAINDVREDFTNVKDTITILNQIRDTAFTTNLPFAELAQGVMRGAGFLTEQFGDQLTADQIKRLTAKRQVLAKGLAIGAMNAMSRLDDLGAVTDFKARISAQTTPSLDMEPDAINFLMAKDIQSVARAARAQELEIPESELRSMESWAQDILDSSPILTNRQTFRDQAEVERAIEARQVNVGDIVEIISPDGQRIEYEVQEEE